jgi:hypothetical protein
MKKQLLFLLFLIPSFTQTASNPFTPEQMGQISSMIQQNLKKQSAIQEIKDYATQGVGYSVCTAGMLYGLNHLGSAYKHAIKSSTPITNSPEQEKKRYNRLMYSHAAMGLLCCSASAYGLYYVWNTY